MCVKSLRINRFNLASLYWVSLYLISHPEIFQTKNSVRSKHLILNYPRFKLSGFEDIGIR